MALLPLILSFFFLEGEGSLVPRPPPFFVLRFRLAEAEERKNGEGLRTPIT